MGTSTDGILAYGYDFGAEESLNLAEAQVSDTNEFGFLKTAWCDAEHEDSDGDLVVTMTRLLYESIPDAPPAKYDWDREQAVKAHLGVWFEAYCSGSYQMWILTTHVITVSRGDTETIDPTALAAGAAAGDWDAKLAHALNVLGVHPTQDKPRWLLASFWGT